LEVLYNFALKRRDLVVGGFLPMVWKSLNAWRWVS
jgi:hypothetical protein